MGWAASRSDVLPGDSPDADQEREQHPERERRAGVRPLGGVHVGEDVRAAIDTYLNRHPEVDGGVRVGWLDGRRTLFVGIVGEPGAHRAALARIGGERVVLEPGRPRTVGELEALVDRMLADLAELHAAGFEIAAAWQDPARGMAEVEIIGGSNEAAARDYLAARYGDAVAVEWLGPHSHREVPHAF